MFGLTSAHASKAVTLKVAVVHATKTKRNQEGSGSEKDQTLSQKSLRKNWLYVLQASPEADLEISCRSVGCHQAPGRKKALVKYTGKKAKRHMVKLSIPKKQSQRGFTSSRPEDLLSGWDTLQRRDSDLGILSQRSKNRSALSYR